MSLTSTCTSSFNTSKDGEFTTAMDSIFAMPEHLFAGEIFPNFQPKPPLAQFEGIFSCPMACYLACRPMPVYSCDDASPASYSREPLSEKHGIRSQRQENDPLM